MTGSARSFLTRVQRESNPPNVRTFEDFVVYVFVDLRICSLQLLSKETNL